MWGSGYSSSVINYRHPGASGAEKTIADAMESHWKAHERHVGKTVKKVMDSFDCDAANGIDRNYRGKI